MEMIYKGKTKMVYKLENGNILMHFKDDVTGEGGAFDPGANTIGLSIDGIGKEWLRITEHFFKLFEKSGIPTHFISADIENSTMEVKHAKVFGKGLECICRFKSTGSFMRRYGGYAKEGQDLDGFVEITLKDDEREDPVISEDTLVILGLLDREAYSSIKKMTRDISILVKEELEKFGVTLYDIKLEFGVCDGKIILIDEISGGNMRVYKDGRPLEPLEIGKIILG